MIKINIRLYICIDYFNGKQTNKQQNKYKKETVKNV